MVKNTDINIANEKNRKIVENFELLVNHIKYNLDHASTSEESNNNYYRLRQLKNSIEIVKKIKDEIVKGEQLAHIKGIGKGTIGRINEILEKGRLSEIPIKEKHKKYLAQIENLEQIFGIGRKTAYEFITKYNIKSIDELKQAYKKNQIKLNDQIVLGLKYHNVYKENIPRKEIDEINILLEKVASNIDSKLSITICGSYRRGKETSNDIDVLLVHKDIKTQNDFKSNENYLYKFINKLKNIHFIIDDLTYDDYETKYMGFCQLTVNKVKYDVRRIDIRYICYESYYPALLYFTGSSNFNAKMRNLAKDLGYKLNEYGLYKVDGVRKTKIKIKSEKDIFDKLGMEYITPDKR